MNAAASPTASATAPSTAPLAASTSGRLGMAASVAWIIPEEYSPVIASTPRTPVNRRPSAMPASALLVRSAAASSVLTPTATAMPTAPATVAPSAHQVERRLRSLIHSILATCANR
jgi:hypothetical protein